MALNRKKMQKAIKFDDRGVLCDDMSFTYSEICKMLRTKINMLLPDELTDFDGVDDESEKKVHRCRTIGVTSSLRGEGKSTTSINLAYTIAEAGYKVCLIEADMRIPNIARRLSLKPTPGLSELLTGQNTGNEVLRRYKSKKGVKVYAVTAGSIPPLPSELLDSKNFTTMLKIFSETFDYIIVDLPPVTVVTDALIVSKKIDGMIVVVRQDYCDKASLQDTLSQLKMAESNILGVVLNCSDGSAGGSGHKYSNKYYQ